MFLRGSTRKIVGEILFRLPAVTMSIEWVHILAAEAWDIRTSSASAVWAATWPDLDISLEGV